MKIIAGVDGSEDSKRALTQLSHLSLFKGTCVLANVASWSDLGTEGLPEAMARELDNVRAEARLRADVVLEEARAQARSSSLALECRVLAEREVMPPERALDELAQEEDADMVVVGARGLNPVKAFFVGSVSDRLMRYGKKPVMISRPPSGITAPSESAERLRLVVGFDGSDDARAALAFLGRCSLESVAEIHVVSVVRMNYYCGMGYSLASLETWPQYRQSLEAAMTAACKALEGRGPEIIQTVRPHAHDVASEISHCAQNVKADLVVVGSSGKGLVDRALEGSVSSRLAHFSGAPCWWFDSQAPDGERRIA